MFLVKVAGFKSFFLIVKVNCGVCACTHTHQTLCCRITTFGFLHF